MEQTRSGSIAAVVERSAASRSGSSSASSVGAGNLGDVKRQVVVEALGGLPVGAVQLAVEVLERALWHGVEAQRDPANRGGQDR